MQKLNPHDKRTLFTVIFILFIDIIGFTIIFPLFPSLLEYYLKGGRIDPWLVDLFNQLVDSIITVETEHRRDFLCVVLFGGIIGSLYGILQFIFSPIWGRLSDVYGRKPILLLTVMGNLIGYGMWIFAGSFNMLLLSRVICGAMSGNLSVATAAVADMTSAENRSRGMALVGVAFGLAFIIGPALGALSVQFNLLTYLTTLSNFGINSFSSSAILAFLLTVLNLYLCIFYLKETLPAKINPSSLNPTSLNSSSTLNPTLSDLSSIKIVIYVNLLYCFINGGMEFMLTFLGLERLNFGPKENGIMFVYLGLILVTSQAIFVRRYGRLIGEKLMSIVGFLFGGLGYAVIALSYTIPIFFLGITFLSIGVSFAYPSLSALVSLYSDKSEQGRHLGSYRSLGALGRAIGPLSGALSYFYFGAKLNYFIGAAILFFPLLLTLYLKKPQPVND